MRKRWNHVSIFRLVKRSAALVRRWVCTVQVKMKCEKYCHPLSVNYRSNVTRRTRLGRNVNFNGMTIEGGGLVVIGDNFHSGRECLMISQVHDYDFGNAIPYDSENYLLKDIIIEDNVWLGTRVIILGGVTIGEGAIIQAGSVVVSDIPKYAIAGGHPAKVFKFRDIEHYNKLKISGCFI